MRGFCLYIHDMRRIVFISMVLIGIAGFGCMYALFGSGTTFSTNESVDIYIPTGTVSTDTVLSLLEKNEALAHPFVVKTFMSITDYQHKIKPGRYTIDKDMSSFRMFKKLFSGRTDAVKLVINKLRTKEDLITFLDKKLEADAIDFMRYMNNPDSVKKIGLDTQNVVTLFIPNTYQIDWTIPVSKFMYRMKKEHDAFWNNSRKARLKIIGLTEEEVYILASIVEEETNKHDEKPIISSVYLNRLKRNMPLGADPTVKFALRDFGIKRVTFSHIRNSSSSAYNTYLHKGLPPGPICTPSEKSIDGVLYAPSTDYIFFCARPDFSGYHNFASNEKDHFINAKAYQKALDRLSIH